MQQKYLEYSKLLTALSLQLTPSHWLALLLGGLQLCTAVRQTPLNVPPAQSLESCSALVASAASLAAVLCAAAPGKCGILQLSVE